MVSTATARMCRCCQGKDSREGWVRWSGGQRVIFVGPCAQY